MKKTIRTLLTATVVALGLGTTISMSAPIAKAATDDETSVMQYQLPHVVQIETGHYSYMLTKPIGFQTLEGISPLMLINPDGIIHSSKIKVTMSDGTILLQWGKDNAYYVDASQVEAFNL